MQTKNGLLHTLLFLGLALLTFEANSQTWQLGGNPDVGPNGIGTPPNNKLGSLQNTNVDFITNGVTRMTLRGQNDATIGWLGLAILNPVHQLHIHQSDAFATSNTGIAITDASIMNPGASGSQDGLHLHVNPANSGADIAWLEPTPLGIHQNGGERMRFTMNGVNESRIGFPVNSSILIPNPMSLLHLGDPGNITMQRNWMNVGITQFNPSNQDLLYLGLQTNDAFQTDAVLGWGCHTGPLNGPDNLRFVFLAPVTGGPNPENTQLGLEVGRFAPDGNFGVGNFSLNGINVQPTQRLDINGNARFRVVTDNTDNVLITGTTNAEGDYTLSRINLGTATNQYLANNGTWQVIPTGESTTANNGVSLNGTTVQLGNDGGGDCRATHRSSHHSNEQF